MNYHYQKIANYLAFAEKEYNISICIKDYSGFIPVNRELDEALQPFLTHANAFCMYIKSDRHIYHKCLTMIRKMNNRFRKDRCTFFGMCHAGLCEYVTPIINGDFIIGTINIGFFGGYDALALNRIHHVCAQSGLLLEEEAVRLYRKSFTPPTISPEVLIPTMELIAEYLSMTYHTITSV